MSARTVIGAVLAACSVLVGIGAADARRPRDPSPNEYRVESQLPDGSFLIGNATSIGSKGFVSIYGDEFGGTSTVNSTFDNTIMPNAFIVDPSHDGTFGVTYGSDSFRYLVLDSVAHLAENPYTTILKSPERIADTRAGGRLTVAPGGTTVVRVDPQRAGQMAIINLTVDGNQGRGWLATYPCAEGYQGTAALNALGSGGAQAIMNVVKIDANGDICVRSQRAATGVIVDLLGFFDTNAEPTERRVDTRIGLGGGRLAGGQEHRIVVGEPNTVFMGTIAVTNTQQAGWIAVYTDAGGYNGTSTLNRQNGLTRANLIIVRTDATGAIHVMTSGGFPPGLDDVDIVIDGTIVDELAPFLTMASERILDTRFEAPNIRDCGHPDLADECTEEERFDKVCGLRLVPYDWVDLNENGLFDREDEYQCRSFYL